MTVKEMYMVFDSRHSFELYDTNDNLLCESEDINEFKNYFDYIVTYAEPQWDYEVGKMIMYLEVKENE